MAFEYKPYEESDYIRQLREQLAANQGNKPGAYTSQYGDQIAALGGQIQNRQPFQYDINADALYKQYAQQYQQGGQRAMQDTVGQVAALTGGYGNSYAQQAGQQAYQQYLMGLNDKIPELAGAALDRYNAEGNALYQQYAMLQNAEAQDYDRYRDDLNLWMNQQNQLQGQLDNERSLDYNRYLQDRAISQDQYNAEQKDAAAAAARADDMIKYYISMGVMPPEDILSQSQYDRRYWEQMLGDVQKAQKGTGGGYGGNGGNGNRIITPDMGLLNYMTRNSSEAGDGSTGDADDGNGSKRELSAYAKLDNAAQSMDPAKVQAMVRDAVASGAITQNQANRIIQNRSRK